MHEENSLEGYPPHRTNTTGSTDCLVVFSTNVEFSWASLKGVAAEAAKNNSMSPTYILVMTPHNRPRYTCRLLCCSTYNANSQSQSHRICCRYGGQTGRHKDKDVKDTSVVRKS